MATHLDEDAPMPISCADLEQLHGEAWTEKYLEDDSMTQEERGVVEAHIFACQRCAGELQEAKRFYSIMREAVSVDPGVPQLNDATAEFYRGLLKSKLFWLAIAIIVLVCGTKLMDWW